MSEAQCYLPPNLASLHLAAFPGDSLRHRLRYHHSCLSTVDKPGEDSSLPVTFVSDKTLIVVIYRVLLRLGTITMSARAFVCSVTLRKSRHFPAAERR